MVESVYLPRQKGKIGGRYIQRTRVVSVGGESRVKKGTSSTYYNNYLGGGVTAQEKAVIIP